MKKPRTDSPSRIPWLTVLIAVVLLPAGGCELDKQSLWSPTVGWPQATGLVARDYECEYVGVLGFPAGGGLDVCPNPGDVFQIRLTVPERTRVTVWVSRALGPGDPGPAYNAGFGTTSIPILPPAEVVTLLDEYLDGGVRLVVWNGKDDLDRRQPTGWYRLFARVGTEVLFCDVWYLSFDDYRFPPGFMELFEY